MSSARRRFHCGPRCAFWVREINFGLENFAKSSENCKVYYTIDGYFEHESFAWRNTGLSGRLLNSIQFSVSLNYSLIRRDELHQRIKCCERYGIMTPLATRRGLR
jgi:hypothetical protein